MHRSAILGLLFSLALLPGLALAQDPPADPPAASAEPAPAPEASAEAAPEEAPAPEGEGQPAAGDPAAEGQAGEPGAEGAPAEGTTEEGAEPAPEETLEDEALSATETEVMENSSASEAPDFSLAGALKHLTFWTWGVAITLLIMSVLSVAVAINRAMFFFRARKQSLLFAGAIADDLSAQKVDAVLEQAEAPTYAFSYLARIVEAGLKDARDTKTRAGSLDNVETVGSAMERVTGEELRALRRWLTILATVASTAPFVGLLGTVFGIINSFKEMGKAETAGITAVAGGIAEALYMTGFGLVVAIPAVWLYNWATSDIETFEGEMSSVSSEMLDWVKKNKSAV